MDKVFEDRPGTPADPVPGGTGRLDQAGPAALAATSGRSPANLARLHLLARVNQAILGTLDLDQLGGTVCREARRLLAFDAFYLAIYDPAVETLHFLFTDEDGLTDRGRSQPLGPGPTSQVIRSRRPYLVETPDDPIQHAELRFGDESKPAASAIHAPLLLDDQVIGAISVQSYRPGAYDASDVEVLMAMADAAAVAIRNAQLHRRAIEQWQRLRSLFEALEDGLALFDAAGRLLFANRAARAIWGRPVIPGHTRDHTSHRPGHGRDLAGQRAVEQVLRTGQPANMTVSYQPSDAPPRRAHVSALPLFNQGAVEAVALVIRPASDKPDVELPGRIEQTEDPVGDRAAVLVAAGDRQFRRLVRSVLGGAGYRVVEAPDADDALRALEADPPDLALVDVERSEQMGAAITRWGGGRRPLWVAVVDDADDETARVAGLEAGADDCWPKALGPAELVARARAILRRRPRPSREHPLFEGGGLRIDFNRRRVTVSEREVRLTPTEYRLLTTLVGHAGRVLTNDQLLSLVWGAGYQDAPASLRAYVRRLRQKLGDDPQRPRYILTEYGVGYRFKAEP